MSEGEAAISPQPGTAWLLFDRDCGFCTRAAGLLRRIDRRGRVEIIALQEQGAPARFGVTLDQALEQLWALDAQGRRYGGAAAANAVLGVALGTRIPFHIYRIPGIRQLQDALYRWIAANRYRLPGSSGTCAVEPQV